MVFPVLFMKVLRVFIRYNHDYFSFLFCIILIQTKLWHTSNACNPPLLISLSFRPVEDKLINFILDKCHNGHVIKFNKLAERLKK